MNCRRIDGCERRCSSAVAGYHSGASPGLIQLLKPSKIFGGFVFFVTTFTTFDFWSFIVVKTTDSVKKEQKSGQKLRYFTNIWHFPAEIPEFSRNRAEIQHPGRRSVCRSCGVCCVARQKVNLRRLRCWWYPYKGKQKNGCTGLVMRSGDARVFLRVLCHAFAGSAGRCGALWGCLRRKKPPRRIRMA